MAKAGTNTDLQMLLIVSKIYQNIYYTQKEIDWKQ